MSIAVERVILVEGFLDRAFVSGLLKRLGCRSLGASGQPAPRDPWGGEVKGGQFAYASRTNQFIRVMSIGGNKFERRVRTLAEQSKTQSIAHLLVVPDADLPVGADVDVFVRSKCDAFSGLCAESTALSDRSFTCRDIARVDVGVWSALDAAQALPPKQTLERLVCAAIASTHAHWFNHAAAFVDSRPSPPAPSGKEAAMALMAGWFSGRLSEGFFEAVWEDEGIARELEQRLRVTKTFDAFDAVAT